MKIEKLFQNNRFNFLVISILTFTFVVAVFCTDSSKTGNNGWYQVPEIINHIVVPTFPDRDYLITDFGAIADGETDCHKAIAAAIKACNGDGGGRVIISEGTFKVNGPIHLKSNVHLYLSEAATIEFSSNPDHYLPVVLTRWEGTELYNYSPLIYAYQATNIAITGKGTIDGNAKKTFATWRPKQKPAQAKLRQMGNDSVPVNKRVFGKGHWLRPSMIQPFGCKNVLIDSITIVDSPFWVIHPTFCINVTIRNVCVESWNPNNDGCDPDASVNVLIENCTFNTGDDAIAIKSGRDQDGWRIGQATENVVIRDCEMKSKANGLCIGSEMSGGVRNILMEDCQVGEAESTIYFKSNLDRGGMIENVRVRNVTVERAKAAFIRFESNYKGHRGNHYPPIFRNFVIENITCGQADNYGIYAVGTQDAPVQDVTLKDITITQAKIPTRFHYTTNIIFDNVRINGEIQARHPELILEQDSSVDISW